jgi:hypothetical protein
MGEPTVFVKSLILLADPASAELPSKTVHVNQQMAEKVP